VRNPRERIDLRKDRHEFHEFLFITFRVIREIRGEVFFGVKSPDAVNLSLDNLSGFFRACLGPEPFRL